MAPRDYINLHEMVHGVLEQALTVHGEAYMLSRVHGPFAPIMETRDITLMRDRLEELMYGIGALRTFLDVAETEAARQTR